MKSLVCRLAWWVLWRWWPDRVIYHYGPPDWDTGQRWIKEFSVREWKRLYDRGIFHEESMAYEKLDHGGRKML